LIWGKKMKSAIGIFAGLGLLIAVLSVQKPSVEMQEQEKPWSYRMQRAVTQADMDAAEDLREMMADEACMKAAMSDSH